MIVSVPGSKNAPNRRQQEEAIESVADGVWFWDGGLQCVCVYLRVLD